MTTLRCDAANLVGHELRVPQRTHREGNEAARVRARPFVDVPVVVGAQRAQREVGILGRRILEHLTAEARERREAHRPEHAVGVHVVDARVDVETARSHLVEAGRVDAVLLGRCAGDGVQAERDDALAGEVPCFRTIVLGDHPRRQVLELGRHSPFEDVPGLHHMVVHTHQDEIVELHGSPRSRQTASCGRPYQ
jgi:hypothetical protein